MKVLVDADGCPVVNIVLKLCEMYRVPCILLCDTSHEFRTAAAQTLIFDKGRDSVDYALVNRVDPGAPVITQDYGLASMCLSRNARILHQDGWEYTPDNIDALLFQRHTARKIRSSGKRLKGPAKRDPSQNATFEAALHQILQKVSQG